MGTLRQILALSAREAEASFSSNVEKEKSEKEKVRDAAGGAAAFSEKKKKKKPPAADEKKTNLSEAAKNKKNKIKKEPPAPAQVQKKRPVGRPRKNPKKEDVETTTSSKTKKKGKKRGPKPKKSNLKRQRSSDSTASFHKSKKSKKAKTTSSQADKAATSSPRRSSEKTVFADVRGASSSNHSQVANATPSKKSKKKEKKAPKKRTSVSRPRINSSASSGMPPAAAQWVQCEKCKVWRKLPPNVDITKLPDTWYCSMNRWSPSRAYCGAPQEVDEISGSGAAARKSRLPPGVNLYGGDGPRRSSSTLATRTYPELIVSHYQNRYFKRWNAMLTDLARKRYSHAAAFVDCDPIEVLPPMTQPSTTKKRRGRPSRSSRRHDSNSNDQASRRTPSRTPSPSPSPVPFFSMDSYTSRYDGPPEIALMVYQMIQSVSSAFAVQERSKITASPPPISEKEKAAANAVKAALDRAQAKKEAENAKRKKTKRETSYLSSLIMARVTESLHSDDAVTTNRIAHTRNWKKDACSEALAK